MADEKKRKFINPTQRPIMLMGISVEPNQYVPLSNPVVVAVAEELGLVDVATLTDKPKRPKKARYKRPSRKKPTPKKDV